MRFIATLLLVALTACSGPTTTPDAGALPGSAATQPDGGSSGKPSGDPTASESGKPGAGKGSKKEASPGDGSSEQGGSDASGGSDGPNDGGTGSGGPTSQGAGQNRGVASPSPGSYTYSQTGYEEFCQSATCDRSDLPETQSVDVDYHQRSKRSAVAVVDAHVSDRTSTRTTFEFTRRGTRILEMVITVSTGGLDYTTRYRPDPPIRAIELPLSVGKAWSGRWEDNVSGTYEIQVAGRESVHAGKRSVNAFKLTSKTTFRGELKGHQNLTAWIDPSTGQVVKTAGFTTADSSLGRYETRFTTTLSGGPGY